MVVQLIMGWRYVFFPRSANDGGNPHLGRSDQDIQSLVPEQIRVVLSRLFISCGHDGMVFSPIARSCQVTDWPPVLSCNGLQFSSGAQVRGYTSAQPRCPPDRISWLFQPPRQM